MRTTARKLALVGALTGVLLLGTACDREPTVEPSPTVEVDGAGIDWEDCINRESDCFLNKPKTTPTKAGTLKPGKPGDPAPKPKTTRK